MSGFLLSGCLVTDTKTFKGTSVLRPSSQRLQVSADISTLSSVDGFLRPPPSFTLSHPASLFYANEVGRRALCELQLHLQLCVCVWGLGVEKCSVMFRFHLDSAALYIHSVGMKGERKAGFECSGGGNVFRSGPQAAEPDRSLERK